MANTTAWKSRLARYVLILAATLTESGQPAMLQRLNDDDFESLTKAGSTSSSAWLVTFGQRTCNLCVRLRDEMWQIKDELSSKSVMLAHVDIDESPMLQRRFAIKAVPTTILFRRGKMMHFRGGTNTFKELLAFVEKFEEEKADVVPTEPTPLQVIFLRVEMFAWGIVSAAKLSLDYWQQMFSWIYKVLDHVADVVWKFWSTQAMKLMGSGSSRVDL
eukprot:TRINITY_DN99480_c0_g1_i1.p1 TRINITY_DN99480_c0_g1~~TRINITY_DN99480_c0_g1_i1.p1  ORF type:complete len:217 (+),score=37.98 TRINITY_DN99480_c0_g1_i1:88-738(+)